MGQPLDARERAELSELFLELGPDAPTLCEGWTTADLAAHLVIRERHLTAAPGIVLGERIPALGRRTELAMQRTKAKGFDDVVALVRSGPPVGPFRIPHLRTLLNLNEYFVHHEDVRRPNGRGPRSDRPDLHDALWSVLRRGARLQLRGVHGIGVALVRAGTGERVLAKAPAGGEATVELHGAPGELSLLLTGRRGAAEVDVRGEAEAVARFDAAPLGI